MSRVRMICKECGSVNVSSDALARWSEPDQQWEMSSALDNEDCDDCGTETDVIPSAIDPANPICECQNCGWRGLKSFLGDIKDYSQRVEPGEPVPDGECPHCKALCHAECEPDTDTGEPGTEGDDKPMPWPKFTGRNI